MEDTVFLPSSVCKVIQQCFRYLPANWWENPGKLYLFFCICFSCFSTFISLFFCKDSFNKGKTCKKSSKEREKKLFNINFSVLILMETGSFQKGSYLNLSMRLTKFLTHDIHFPHIHILDFWCFCWPQSMGVNSFNTDGSISTSWMCNWASGSFDPSQV